VKIGTLLSDKAMVPESVKYEVDRYLALVSSGQASAELRVVADRLIDWISHDSGASLFLDAPSDEVLVGSEPAGVSKIDFDEIGADETRRRLRVHFQIDRSKK